MKKRKEIDKKEADFTTKLEKWMLYHMLDIPVYGWEVKYPRTINYSFGSDRSFRKELRNLRRVWPVRFIHKFSDIAQMGTPHDGITATGRGFFFFTWNGKRFYAIDAQTIGGLQDDGYKSIDEKMAAIVADVTGELK